MVKKRRIGHCCALQQRNSDSTKAAAENTVAALQGMGAKAAAFQADLTSADAMEKLFTDATVALGRPDIAINTVRMVLKKPIVEKQKPNMT